jgi:hypothetical protein
MVVDRELLELLVVVSRSGDRLLEDRRVRREPADAVVDELGELSARG